MRGKAGNSLNVPSELFGWGTEAAHLGHRGDRRSTGHVARVHAVRHRLGSPLVRARNTTRPSAFTEGWLKLLKFLIDPGAPDIPSVLFTTVVQENRQAAGSGVHVGGNGNRSQRDQDKGQNREFSPEPLPSLPSFPKGAARTRAAPARFLVSDLGAAPPVVQVPDGLARVLGRLREPVRTAATEDPVLSVHGVASCIVANDVDTDLLER